MESYVSYKYLGMRKMVSICQDFVSGLKADDFRCIQRIFKRK